MRGFVVDPSTSDVLDVAKVAIERGAYFATTLLTVASVALAVIGAASAVWGALLFRKLREARDLYKTQSEEYRSLKANLETAVDLSMVEAYFKCNDYAAVAKLCTSIVIDPLVDGRQKARALGMRGMAHKRLNRINEAIEDLSLCLEMLKRARNEHPVSSRNMRALAYYNRACYRSLALQPRDALNDLRRSRSIVDERTLDSWRRRVWGDDDFKHLQSALASDFTEVVGPRPTEPVPKPS